MKAIFTLKNHGSIKKPTFTSLSAAMSQGDMGGHSVPHGLSTQMQQGGGYTAGSPVKKLQEQMGQ